MKTQNEVKENSIEDLFDIVEVEKGDVNSKVLRQGCISVQTPNNDTK
jgi:hypothetical protein